MVQQHRPERLLSARASPSLVARKQAFSASGEPIGAPDRVVESRRRYRASSVPFSLALRGFSGRSARWRGIREIRSRR